MLSISLNFHGNWKSKKEIANHANNNGDGIMNKGKRLAVVSIVFEIIGFTGLVLYSNYIFIYNGGLRYNFEAIESREEFFELWLLVLKIVPFGLLSFVFVILGLVLGLYSMRKIDKGNINYKLALSSVIVGIIGFITALIMSGIYFLITTSSFSVRAIA